MNFGEHIKNIRKELNLTQEQFAQELQVTRQAVSNWENDRNLPDIEMIIEMSSVFNLSLDELILGEKKNMNNMTEKLVKDGSENRRARYNVVSLGIGTFLMIMAVLLLVIKGLSVEYIDADGFLHENFFLIPISFLLSFIGFFTFLITGITNIIGIIRSRDEKNRKNRIFAIIFSGIFVFAFIFLIGITFFIQI